MSPKASWQRRLRRRYKSAKRFTVYLIARALAAMISLLPTPWVIGIGAAIGRLAGRLMGRLRSRAETQLQSRLGLDAPDARRVARDVFANVGRVGAEIVLLPRLIRVLPQYVQLPAEDEACLEQALAEGKGALVVTAHLGNWELLAQRLVATGHQAVTLARKSPNPHIGRWLLARREAGGLRTLNRGGAETIRGMLSALRRGALLGVLIDQDTKVDAVHVPFFGVPAATPVAAAKLVLRRRIPVLAVFIHRVSTGHQLRVQRVALPIEGDRQQQALALTADLTACIEAAVRESPAEWVWFHERWKTAPAEA